MLVVSSLVVEVEGPSVVAEVPGGVPGPGLAVTGPGPVPGVPAAPQSLDERELHGLVLDGARLGGLQAGDRLTGEESLRQGGVETAGHAGPFTRLVLEGDLDPVDQERRLCGGDTSGVSLVVGVELFKCLHYQLT